MTGWQDHWVDARDMVYAKYKHWRANRSRSHSLTWSWEGLSGVVAVVGLAAAVLFNGCQVSQGADSLRESRTATELQLLTQLQTVLKETVYGRYPYIGEIRALRRGVRRSVSEKAQRAVLEEAADLDYLAWLLTAGHVRTSGAERLWRAVMVCEWRLAIVPVLGQDVVSASAPNLEHFVTKHQSSVLREQAC
jgi:hypothetical protein